MATKRKEYAQATKKRVDPVQLNGFEDLAALVASKRRILLPTQRRFILEHPATTTVKAYCGPAGCAKTTTGCAAVIVPALMYPGSRWLVAREVYGTLEETTMQRFNECLDRLGPGIIVDEITHPTRKIWLAPMVQTIDGKPAPLVEIWFDGLDKDSKIGSTEFTGVFVDEANEIEKTMADSLKLRLRHPLPGQMISIWMFDEGAYYLDPDGVPQSWPALLEKHGVTPDMLWDEDAQAYVDKWAPIPTDRPEGPFFLMFCYNPTAKSHWLHRYFCTSENCETWSDEDAAPEGLMGIKYKPEPRENESNLPRNYYDTQAQGMLSYLKVRMIGGNCGPDPTGEPVFGEVFSQALHVVEQFIRQKQWTYIRIWDGGHRRPACTWVGVEPTGAINVLRARLGNHQRIKSFITEVKTLTSLHFPEVVQWIDVVDEHMIQEQSTSGMSDIEIMRQEGLQPRWMHSSIDEGLNAIEDALTTNVRSSSGLRPKIQFAKDGANYLIEALSSGYKWPKKGKGGDRKPFKDGFYDHGVDRLRYLLIMLASGLARGEKPKIPDSFRRIANPLTGY